MPNFDGPSGRMHYLHYGTGEPAIVLLHGFPLTAEMWEPQIDGLRDRYELVVPDFAGFGGSDLLRDERIYSVNGWAEDVAALVGSLRLKSVVLCGLSMGGYVAFAFARMCRPELVGLILADTRPESDTAEIRRRRERQQELLRRETDIDVLASCLLRGLAATAPNGLDSIATARKLLALNKPSGLIGALEALKNRADSTRDLANISVPTLVLVGDQDYISPLEAERIAGAIACARLNIIPQAGHLSNIDNPSAFTSSICNFVDDLG